MKWILFLGLFLLLPACSPAARTASASAPPIELWQQAREAFVAGNFARAENSFRRLATLYPATPEGRESLFYLGVLHLDPRNPGWNPQPAAASLRRYLNLDTTEVFLRRHPEAITLLGLADQLNMPPTSRISGLQPPPDTSLEERVVAPAAETIALAAEVASLREQLAQQSEQLEQQREELERIRRTLAPRRPGDSALIRR